MLTYNKLLNMNTFEKLKKLQHFIFQTQLCVFFCTSHVSVCIYFVACMRKDLYFNSTHVVVSNELKINANVCNVRNGHL